MVKIGFGTYRVSDASSGHIEALTYALRQGCRLIDTATNYADGGAQRAVANAIAQSGLPRTSLRLIGKAGYIQGTLLRQVQLAEREALECVHYADGCWHSIHPAFLKEELTRSLKRLNTDYLDYYLLHDPEIYLIHTLRNDRDPARIQTARGEMRRRILEAFIAMEEEVQRGRIRRYGVSANALAEDPASFRFLPYTDLPELAKEAAAEVGEARHSFEMVQLPINLWEQEGLKCAAWAKANGIKVVTNRPLNARSPHGMRRLATYAAPENYAKTKARLLEAADALSNSELRGVVEEMDRHADRFPWPEAAELALQRQILPFIQAAIKRLPDPALKERIVPHLNPFLKAWLQQTAHACGQKSLAEIRQRYPQADTPLQRFALKWLLLRPEIDAVLLGMRQKSYVDDALAVSG